MLSRNARRLLSLAVALALTGGARAQLNPTHELRPLDGAGDAEFGWSVAASAGRALVGARHAADNGLNSGAAYLFDTLTGTQVRELLPNDGAAGDEFGYSVAMGSGRVVVGARYDDDNGNESGSVYVFDALTGAQLLKLLPLDGAAGDEFGHDVAIHGGVIVVGSKRDDDNGSDSGSAYLFDAFTGAQIRKLLPLDGAQDDNFGGSVDLDADRVVVGAHGDDDNNFLSGSAYLFDVATGAQVHKLLPLDGAFSDFFGSAVAIADGVVVVGAWANSDSGDHSGSAYLFDAATGMQTAKLLPTDNATRDHFGFDVDIDAGVVLIGAEQDGDSAFAAGSAYVYDTTGEQTAKLLASDSAPNDFFGSAVAVSAGTIVIGAHAADDVGPSCGTAYLFDAAGSPGTAFCFGFGVQTSCPCGNEVPFGTTTGCLNSTGVGARLDVGGAASVANDTLTFTVAGCPPGAFALLVSADNALPAALPGIGIPTAGDGLRCVGGNLQRHGGRAIDASGAPVNPWGGTGGPAGGLIQQGGFGASQVRLFQVFYRDLSTAICMNGLNTTNAMRVLFQP